MELIGNFASAGLPPFQRDALGDALTQSGKPRRHRIPSRLALQHLLKEAA